MSFRVRRTVYSQKFVSPLHLEREEKNNVPFIKTSTPMRQLRGDVLCRLVEK